MSEKPVGPRGKRPASEYESFNYLRAGEDYPAFKLGGQAGRVSAYDLELTAGQQQRVQKLSTENLLISLHDHLTVLPEDAADIPEYFASGFQVIGFEGLRQSPLDAIFENAMVGSPGHLSNWQATLYALGLRQADIAQSDLLVLAGGCEDILAAREKGQIAIVPSLESADAIERDVDRLDVLYGFGIRSMGIVYNEANLLGCGLGEQQDSGLTDFGYRAVERMNQLGILIDISHASDQTRRDTIKASADPVVISHAGARGLWNIPRLVPDDIIEACAERGGVIGIEGAPHTTISPAHRQHNLESFMEHFEYCVDLVGIDHVTFGPDTMYGDHFGLHGGILAAAKNPDYEFEPVEYVAGVENPTETFPSIVGWLVKHGYSDDEIRLVTGGNTWRVLQQVWRH